MSTPEISVIIPCYNRSEALRLTLLALAQQTLPPDQFEVILVDDGSTEDLPGLLASLQLTYPLRFLQQPQRGPAAARNLGSSQAQGKVLLFLDSDMIATPALLIMHLESHDNAPSLVVGPRSRYPETGTPDLFDRFNYRLDGTDTRLDKVSLSFQEVFTCNLSIQKDAWKSCGGFDERFPSASFEDIEFAFRAVQTGYLIKFNHAALAYHNHPLSFQERCHRAVSYTQTVPLCYRSHPDLQGQIAYLLDKEPLEWRRDAWPLILLKLARQFLAIPWVLRLVEWSINLSVRLRMPDNFVRFLYWQVISSYQLIGLREGYRKYGI
jgi:glycosyltransferase involved in cell wall biosynthesis